MGGVQFGGGGLENWGDEITVNGEKLLPLLPQTSSLKMLTEGAVTAEARSLIHYFICEDNASTFVRYHTTPPCYLIIW